MRSLRAARKSSIRRPVLWRLIQLQCLVLLVATVFSALFWPEWVKSLLLAGLISLLAQSFWIWRSLRGFGDPKSGAYLAGAAAGMMGKWVIIFVGLLLLWRSELDISVAVTVVTVFGLNTLAAVAAPILISQPH